MYKIYKKIQRWFQRRIRGWDDSDTWSLDYTIAKFVYPRLLRFRKVNNGFPVDMTFEEWNNKLDDMIYAMKITMDDLDDEADFQVGADWERVDRGLKYFGKHFRHLWW